jgi:hypothetical protein
VGWFGFLKTAANLPADPVTFDSGSQNDVIGFQQLYPVVDLSYTSKVSRREALSVPAVRSADRLISAKIATLPLVVRNKALEVQESSFLLQPEIDRPYFNTMSATIRDLLFDNVAYWQVIDRDFDGYPAVVRRLEVGSVRIQNGVAYIGGRKALPGELIIFYGPNENGALYEGARAIRQSLELDKTAARYAAEPQMIGYFTPADDTPVDYEPDPVATSEFMGDYRDARKTHAEGYVPRSLKHVNLTIDPKQLQLVEARQHAVLEIARAFGIDAEDLGVSTTSRTYFNSEDRTKQTIVGTLSPYMNAVEQRLSMQDVTRPGHTTRFDVEELLRPSQAERFANYSTGKAAGFLTIEEIRTEENLPALEDTNLPVQPLAIEGNSNAL